MGGSNLIRPAKTNQVIPAYTDTELTVEGSADLLPQNIRKGINLFGVAGAMKEGVKGVVWGMVTVDRIRTVTVSHNLGKIPSKVVIVGRSYNSISFSTVYLADETIVLYRSTLGLQGDEFTGHDITNKQVTFNCSISERYDGTYYWFAIA